MDPISKLDGIYIFEAKNHELYSFSNAVYIWYYPILFKYLKKDPDEVINNYFDSDYDKYCLITSSEIVNNSKNQISIHKSFNSGMSYNLEFESRDYTRKDVKKFFETLKLLSFLGKALYVGMSSRNDESGLSKRIGEHLKRKTHFSRKLEEDLSDNDTRINVENMIIVAFNIEEIVPQNIRDSFQEGFNIALFIEKILIDFLSPKYNERI